jgi:peroxiredoxin
MNKKTALWSPLLGVALLLVFSGSLAAAALKVGYQAGNLKFVKVISEADQKYLGLKNSGPFTLKDIQSEYVCIEVLNANCPHCMEQAAALNRLYRLVEDSDLKDRLKFIGVVSNSEAAVTKWQKAYKVPFALVPDPEWEIAGDLNITGTPTTVVVDKSGKVIVLHDGVFSDAPQVFKQLKAKLK